MSHILRFFYNVLFDNPINDVIRVSYTRLYLVIKQSKSKRCKHALCAIPEAALNQNHY